ncbi:VWA domain-containing protein [Zhouia sp. PK063]|uniref:VWA domain-containing protein n=1 Tax=Zhouia sp. PK063 TaxID=3373602 RepID=UPI0037A14E00
MQSTTILLIILAAIFTFVLAYFQYIFKERKSTKQWLFVLCRSITYFLLLILIINPKIKHATIITEKPKLIVLADNSQSIKELKQNTNEVNALHSFLNDKDLQSKFEVLPYVFGSELKATNTLDFTEKQTEINNALHTLQNVYKNQKTATIIITDGNQTFGTDYQYEKFNQPIFPIVLGDTIPVQDLKIQQVNVNKYAYLHNKFPVEILMSYQGNTPVTAMVSITENGTSVFTQKVNFNSAKLSLTVNAELNASSKGVKTYRVSIKSNLKEKNSINNTKQFAVEVIDESTKIALVSKLMHPDLGAIKKAIETNEQRKVTVLSPDDIQDINDYQLLILYQPDASFNTLFKIIKKQYKNTLIIAGTKTDWNFLNQVQSAFSKAINQQTEDVQPTLNKAFRKFLFEENLDFRNYPPLKASFGDLLFTTPHDDILYRQVSGINTRTPLLSLYDNGESKNGVLFGENIWKWRSYDYQEHENFVMFDDFITKIVQYLASSKKRERLSLQYESFYYGSQNLKINASYLDENYEFNLQGKLAINIQDTRTKQIYKRAFLLNGHHFEVDLSNLPPSEYTFTVTSSDGLRKSGNFTILEFNIEKQFINADAKRLLNLSLNSGGQRYFINNFNQLQHQLKQDKRFIPVQKSISIESSLINWKWLLSIIILVLTGEWFVRKYNGLI